MNREKTRRYRPGLRETLSSPIKGLEENETMITTIEASKLLAITPNALRIQVHRGKVQAYKLGNKLRFRKKDVLSCMADREA